VTYYEKDFWAHNTALFVADFHGNDPRFASYFLTFLNLGRFRSGASVPTLDRNVFRKLPIVAPPVPEQQKIAAVLGLVQRAIEQQERLLVLTTELKKALLHQLFTYGLRQESQKQTELGPIPQSWEVARIEELVIRGILAKPLDGNHGNIHPKSDDFVPEGIPFIMASDLKNGGIDLSGCAHLRKEQADKLQNGLHPVPKTPS
jgi:type I restriction enzyme S subunit